MLFIGIVTDKKTEKEFKKINNSIIINSKTIDNIKNIKFDILIVNDTVNLEQQLIEKIILNSKLILMNADLKNCFRLKKEVTVITYGLNSKATVTASSLEEEIIICIQRGFYNLKKRLVEPQEIKVKKGINIYFTIVETLVKIAFA